MIKKIIYSLTATLLLSAPAMADTWETDESHTFAYFKINHFGHGDFTAVFTDVAGTLLVDGKDDSNPKLDLVLKINSLNSFNKKRDDHILGPDFLDAKRFKEAKFKSTKVVKKSDSEYLMDGKFTLHGVTKDIKGVKVVRGRSANDPWGNFRTGGNAFFEIDRTDFGIKTYPEPALGHKVKLEVYWEALRKKENK